MCFFKKKKKVETEKNNINKEKFSKVIELFKERTQKDCYKIDIVNGEPSVLDNKIGGRPYLPIGEEYPKDKDGNNLALLLQVNLKDIDLERYPKKGILEIYTDSNVDYPCRYAVKYFEEGLDYQTDLPDIDLSNHIVNKSYKIKLTKDVCHMPLSDYRFLQTILPIVNEIFETDLKDYDELDDYFDFDWHDEFFSKTINHSITVGGYADFTQEDPRSNMKNKKESCLFKLDSQADFDKFNIGDSGILFVLISQKDIEKCNFSNAIVDWDCC